MKNPLFLMSLILAFGLSPWAFAQTYTVTTTTGGTAAGSLGAAISSSSSDGAAISDTVGFSSLFNSNQTITLSASYPSVVKNSGVNLTLNAPGALLTLNGGGNTIFNFSGGGTLSLSNMAVTNGSITLGSNSTLSLNNVADSGIISGAGMVFVSGGTVTLKGTNTFSGGISISGGTLSVIDTHALGNSATTISINGGVLQAGVTDLWDPFMTTGQSFYLGSAGATIDVSGGAPKFSGTISGPGGLTVTDVGAPGGLWLSGFNDYTGGTTLVGVTVRYYHDVFGTGTVVLDGATLAPWNPFPPVGLDNDVYLRSAGATFGDLDGIGGDISGVGGLVYNGYSGANYTGFIGGNNTYSGGTTLINSYLPIANNTAAFGSGATIYMDNSGIYASDIDMPQHLQISSDIFLDGHGSAGITLSGGISGTGSVYFGKNPIGWGTCYLTVPNGYSGDTRIGYGAVALVGSGSLGSGGLTVDSTGVFDISAASGAVTLPFLAGAGWVSLGANPLAAGGDDSDRTFSGTISGAGAFVKVGTGAATLTGANAFTGGLLLDAGAILAGNNNALGAGSVTLAGGTLGMTGGPRTLNVNGDYVQGAAATLRVGLASAFPYDQLNVVGDAVLSGALTLFNYSVVAPVSGQTFLILQSGGDVSGRFSTVQNPFTTVRMLPLYEPDQVFLVAVLPSFNALAVTPNQKAVAAALDQAFGSEGTQDLTLSLGQQTTSSLPSDYDQIAPTGLLPVFQMGFATARAQGDLMARHFSGVHGTSGFSTVASRWPQADRLFAGNLPAAEEAAMGNHTQGDWSLFVERQNVSDSVVGDSNAPGYQFVSNGLTAGIENQLSPDLAIGLLFGYGQGNTVPGSNGSVNVAGGQAGLYAGWNNAGTYMEASGTVGLNRYQTQRPSYGGYAAGSTGGHQFSGQAGLGHDWQAGPTRLGLFASGQATYVAIDGFSETGSLAPLTFSAQGETSVLSDLGARATRRFILGDFTFDPGLSLAWEHRYQGNADSLSSGFSGTGAFTVTGPTAWTEALVVGAGLDVRLSQTLSLSFQYRDLVGIGNGGSEAFTGGMDLGF